MDYIVVYRLGKLSDRTWALSVDSNKLRGYTGQKPGHYLYSLHFLRQAFDG